MSHWIHKWLYITVLCQLLNTTLSFYDISPDCSPTKACLPNQVCWHGYCHCEDGYVRYNHTCFKVRSHGEDCFYVEQCPDHRMQCKREPGSSLEVKYCLCDKYHPWNKTMKECVPAVNIKIMLSELWEKVNIESLFRREADDIFWTLGIAAFTVLILGGTLAVFCVVYGCYLTDCLNNENSSTTKSDQRVGVAYPEMCYDKQLKTYLRLGSKWQREGECLSRECRHHKEDGVVSLYILYTGCGVGACTYFVTGAKHPKCCNQLACKQNDSGEVVGRAVTRPALEEGDKKLARVKEERSETNARRTQEAHNRVKDDLDFDEIDLIPFRRKVGKRYKANTSMRKLYL